MFYVDADGDGFGNPEIVVEICELPGGYVNNESDCDDAHSQKYPGAEEICDQLDSNCNGDIDEGLEQYFLWTMMVMESEVKKLYKCVY